MLEFERKAVKSTEKVYFTYIRINQSDYVCRDIFISGTDWCSSFKTPLQCLMGQELSKPGMFSLEMRFREEEMRVNWQSKGNRSKYIQVCNVQTWRRNQVQYLKTSVFCSTHQVDFFALVPLIASLTVLPCENAMQWGVTCIWVWMMVVSSVAEVEYLVQVRKKVLIDTECDGSRIRLQIVVVLSCAENGAVSYLCRGKFSILVCIPMGKVTKTF